VTRPSTPPSVLPVRLLRPAALSGLWPAARPAVIVPPPVRTGASVPVATSRGVLLPRPCDEAGGEPEVQP